MLSRGRFAVKVVVLEGPLDNYSLQELKAIFVHFRVFSFFFFLLLLLLLLLLRVRVLLLLLLLLRVVLGLVLVRVTCSGPSIHLMTLLGPAWACLGPMLGLCLCWHLFALC